MTRPNTRARILEAAVRRFSSQPYEQTGLREIAADAAVDVAWVHRAFGSKSLLFAEAVQVVLDDNDVFDGPAETLPQRLVDQICRPLDQARPLDIVAQSLSSPDARQVLKEHVERMLITPLGGGNGAALAASLLAGFSILRLVLRVDGLSSLPDGDMRDRLTQALTCLLTPSGGHADDGR